MRARCSVVVLLLVSVLTVGAGQALAQDGPASGPSTAETTPTCAGKEPTKPPLTSPGTLNGTSGDDVLIGSPGDDVINGLGGNDTICGSTNAACNVAPFGGNDQLNGGTGDDILLDDCGLLAPAANQGDGGAGNDSLLIRGKAIGGSGSDKVRSINGTADGGSGNDTVEGSGATRLLGGSGSDSVDNDGGNPSIDCGSAVDTVDADGATNVRRCENTADLDA